MLRRGGLRRDIRRRSGCRRRPTGHSKRHAGDSQNGDGLTPTVSLRRLVSARHLESSHTCGHVAQTIICGTVILRLACETKQAMKVQERH